MYDAMMLSGGIPSLSVTLCDSVTAAQAGPYKINGVSFLSKVAYTTEGIQHRPREANPWCGGDYCKASSSRSQQEPLTMPLSNLSYI